MLSREVLYREIDNLPGKLQKIYDFIKIASQDIKDSWIKYDFS